MPCSIARRAPSRTSTGTGVSQTPWARLMPLIFSHSRDITRISDCTVRAARRLGESDIKLSPDLRAPRHQMTLLQHSICVAEPPTLSLSCDALYAGRNFHV